MEKKEIHALPGAEQLAKELQRQQCKPSKIRLGQLVDILLIYVCRAVGMLVPAGGTLEPLIPGCNLEDEGR